MFFPGETISHKFVVPFNHNEIAKMVITYKQNDHILIEKTITSGFKEEELYVTSVEYQFNQGESLIFEDNSDFTMQINVYTVSGSRHTSHEMRGSNGVQYLREVISDG